MTGGKGIQRLTSGWQARVMWKGWRYEKWFSDNPRGREAARLAAVAWRDDKEAQLRKPRSEKKVYPFLLAGSAKSNTGLVGIYEQQKEGSPVFVVFWAPAKRRRSATSISIRRWGRDEALRRAQEIRAAKVAMRFAHAA